MHAHQAFQLLENLLKQSVFKLTFQNGTCFQRTGPAHKREAIKISDSSLVCGLKKINWKSGNWAFHCDFPGSDLSQVRVPGDRCGSVCWETSKCTHFTWTPEQQHSNINGTCQLKFGSVNPDDAYVTSNPTMVCGFLSRGAIDWRKENYATSCRFTGNDIFALPSVVSECGPKCEESIKCNHFTWENGICYLKWGKIRRKDAKFVDDFSIVCGYIESRLQSEKI